MPTHSLHQEPAVLHLHEGLWAFCSVEANPRESSPSLSFACSKAKMELKREGPGLITPKPLCQSQEEAVCTLSCRKLCSLKAGSEKPPLRSQPGVLTSSAYRATWGFLSFTFFLMALTAYFALGREEGTCSQGIKNLRGDPTYC